ncbi:MAG: L-serine ammonia-lyase, iron-sulfur-dependent, subunit alpha [Oscillospiraceae bacterium]
MSEFESISSLLSFAEEESLPLWKAVQIDDCRGEGISEQNSWNKMSAVLAVMKEADRSYNPKDRSASGLSGGDAGLMAAFSAKGDVICGDFMAQVIAGALRMGECNSCMKRIAAAPTAGACGVLPAVLLPSQRRLGCSDEMLIEALYVAAGIGSVIAGTASISGAEGGCQAEIGSASAMAAAALTNLQGGTPDMCANAAALALKSLLGLVCDPVGGLVEVPCVKRNVIGAVNAVSCAQMALAGIKSRIPPDEVIQAMAEVGACLPQALRETGKGGLAATPTGQRYTPPEIPSD